MLLKLHKCTPNELGLLLQIARKTFADAFEKDNDPENFKAYFEAAFTTKQLLSELNDPNSSFYLVYFNDGLAGYFKVNLNKEPADFKLGKAMELERIYVLEIYHGQKIGVWILDQVKKMAHEASNQFLWLGVWENNGRAIAFYEGNGFKKFGMHPYYIGADKQMDFLMRFDLQGYQPCS